MLPDLLWLGAGLALLLVGADLFVRGASALALRFGLSPLAVGLTVVAFGTSAPELVVSLEAAITGHGGIAVGNVLGSNVANIGLILGACVLVRAAAVSPRLLRVDVPVLLATSAGVAVLLLDGAIGRPDGLLLVLALAAYLVVTLRSPGGAMDLEAPAMPAAPAWQTAALTAAGLIGLLFGGHLLVGSAVGLAEAAGVSEAVIGLTVVAVGTSLPELAASLVAALRGQSDIAVGNVVGSNIFNLLGVLGTSALVAPLDAGTTGGVAVGAMLLAAALAAPLMWTGRRLARWEGALLLSGYAAYLVVVL